MKKVLFIVSTLVRSGPTQQLLNLCRHLPAFGYAPHVLTLSPDPADNIADAFEAAGIERQSLALSRIEGLFMAKSRVRAVIREVQPDVIHTSGIRGDFIGHAVSGRLPHVMTIRNYAWEDYPQKFGRLRGSLMARQHTGLIRKAHCPVACSGSLARKYAAVHKNLHAIHNGVDTAHFVQADDARRMVLRKTLGSDPDRTTIIAVGSLTPNKKPGTLLQAFVSSGLSGTTDLVFIGDGPMRGELEAIANGHPAVHFAGRVNNVGDYLQSADLLVSASRSEGLPNSVLEALACGLPVLISDIEPHLEFGVEAAGAGYTFPVNSSEQLVEGMRDVLARDRHEMSAAARALAENVFSARGTAGAYCDLYDDLLKDRI